MKVWWMRSAHGTSVLWSTRQFLDGDAEPPVFRTADIPDDIWTEYLGTRDDRVIDRYLEAQL